jgi:hypothetical protein
MIKKLFLSCLILTISLNGKDLNKTLKMNLSPLELFLFNIGYTALSSDVGNEKNKTKKNSNDIEILKMQVKYLLEKMDQNRFNNNQDNILVINDDSSENLKIDEEKEQLKNKIITLENKIVELKSYIKKHINLKENINIKNKIIQNKKIINKKIRVIGQKVYLREKPYSNAKIISTLNYNQIVFIESCNKYNWCKIKDKEEYIAEYFLDKKSF